MVSPHLASPANGEQPAAVVVVEAEGDDVELVGGAVGGVVDGAGAGADEVGVVAEQLGRGRVAGPVPRDVLEVGPSTLAVKRRRLRCHRRVAWRVCSRSDQIGRMTA